MFTGAEALVHWLASSGTEIAFAYPGTSELQLCHAVSESQSLKLISSWGDREAAFMAAGANLLAPGRAVSILHGARGLTNALGALADTRRSEFPALHIVGMASRSSAPFLPPHGEHDLIQGAAAFTRHAFDCSVLTGFDATAYAATVSAALNANRQRPYGPVVLGIPQDVLETSFIPASMLTPSPLPESGLLPDLDEASNLIRTSRRPVILVDDYLLLSHRDAELALGRLANAISAPVYQVAYRRGPMLFQRINKHAVPTFADYYDPSDLGHRTVLEEADLIITVEDRNMYPRVIGKLPPCRMIAITSNPEATVKNLYLNANDPLVHGNPAEVLRELADVSPNTTAHVQRSPKIRPPARHQACQSAVALVRAIGAVAVRANIAALVDDSQSLGGLVSRHSGLLPEGLRIFGSHGGFIGSGLPTAAGVAVAADQPILCLLGDQAFTNGVQALACLSAQQVPLLILVCNNHGSVSLRAESGAPGTPNGRTLSHANNGSSYTAIAAGYGIDTARITWNSCVNGPAALTRDAARLLATADRAFSRRIPVLVEVVSPADDSDFWTGTWNTKGYE